MSSNNANLLNHVGFALDYNVTEIIVDDITSKLAALTPLLSGAKTGFDGKERYGTEAARLGRAAMLAKQLRYRFLAIEQLLEAQQRLHTFLVNPVTLP